VFDPQAVIAGFSPLRSGSFAVRLPANHDGRSTDPTDFRAHTFGLFKPSFWKN
jgi:hypothetical protein